MFNAKSIISSALFLLFILNPVFSQEKISSVFIAPSVKEIPITLEAAPQSLAKEVYDLMIAESSDAAVEAKKENIYYTNEALKKYQLILNQVCQQSANKNCPELYFSKREIFPGSKPQTAAMLPIGIMVLSEEDVEQLDAQQATFIISHEYAHHYYGHSLKRINAAAKSVWDHGIMIMEPEKIFMVIPMLPGMRTHLQGAEQEADNFALAYLKFKGLRFDCQGMYKTLLGGKKESTDKHKSTDERCSHMH